MINNKLKEKIRKIIEKHSENTSEGAIYWDYGVEEKCVDEIYKLIKSEIKNDK